MGSTGEEVKPNPESEETAEKSQLELELRNKFRILLGVLHTTSIFSLDLLEDASECTSKRISYSELSCVVQPFMSLDQFKSNLPLYLDTNHKYTTVHTRATNFLRILGQCIQMKDSKLKEIEPVREILIKGLGSTVGEMTIKDPEGVINMLKESIRKAVTVRACYATLIVEWNAMKQDLYTDLNECMQRMIGMSKEILRQLNAGVSEE